MIRQNSCNEKKAVHITFSIHTENTYYQISEYFSTDLLPARKKKMRTLKLKNAIYESSLTIRISDTIKSSAGTTEKNSVSTGIP